MLSKIARVHTFTEDGLVVSLNESKNSHVPPDIIQRVLRGMMKEYKIDLSQTKGEDNGTDGENR